ncbi:MAG: hypothetical protein Q8L04_15245, partial [Ignavibacteria bacterium]|nr:hypothetical protein [Ignavibacteria bacterium]
QMIYFGKIIPVEETVKKIYKVTKEDIRDLSNELFGDSSLTNKFGEFESCSLTRVILSPKNLLLRKA